MRPCILVAVTLLMFGIGCQPSGHVDNQEADVGDGPQVTTVTDLSFNEVAPIFWQKCAGCHRAGEAAPFELITWDHVAKRKDQILEVVESGYMPPWLPNDPHGTFANDTRLTADEKQRMIAWLRADAPQGEKKELPTRPEWPHGWSLGKPDVVVSMSEQFQLPASGPDVYRNFILPVNVDQLSYVRAMEFRPSNHRVVHHAFVMTDTTRRLRQFDGVDGQPGFDGMDTKSATAPDGHFVGWQPGRRPYEAPQGMSWRLLPNTDLVIQVHMQCTGREEQLSVSVGLYFDDTPPQRFPMKLALHRQDIDIPAGQSAYELTDAFQLPIDVDVMAVAPHAHYLAKEMFGLAELPGGQQKQLLRINDWDLNWQSEYRYKEWVRLPAGTVLRQRFIYDNSGDNIRNPHDPPQRVTYGPAGTDEMGSLWVQLLPVRKEDAAKLQQAITVKTVREIVSRNRAKLATQPNDVGANIELGKVAIMTKQTDAALAHFTKALSVEPANTDALYYAGHALLRAKAADKAVVYLRRVVQVDPSYYQAHHDLGKAAFEKGDYVQAESHLRDALRTVQLSVPTLRLLGRSLLKQRKFTEGISVLDQALEIQPDADLLQQVNRIKSQIGLP